MHLGSPALNTDGRQWLPCTFKHLIGPAVLMMCTCVINQVTGGYISTNLKWMWKTICYVIVRKWNPCSEKKRKSSHRLAEIRSGIKNNVTDERSGMLPFLAGVTITLQYHQTGFSANTSEHRKQRLCDALWSKKENM